jgi:hypothetical protein
MLIDQVRRAPQLVALQHEAVVTNLIHIKEVID